MATASTTASTQAAGVPTPVITPQTESTVIATPIHEPTAPARFIVVGAGGNGARVVAPLTQMLHREDRLVIIDHDIVEDRNLLRQHFGPRDVGRPKAEVLATRYRHAMQHAPVASCVKLDVANVAAVANEIQTSAAPGCTNTYIIGCVDNPAARQALVRFTDSFINPTAYIDVGNETRHGQMVMTLRRWPMKVVSTAAGGDVTNRTTGNYTMHGMQVAMPQLLRPAPWHCDDCGVENPAGAVCTRCARAEASCRQRIDIQTVMVNHMAASAALNAVSQLMLRHPLTGAGCFFSTLNTMQTIRIIGTDIDGRSQRQLVPSRAFAIKGA